MNDCQKVIEVQKELIDLLQKDMLKKDKMIRILQAAVREAGHVFSDNPPGDLDKYNEDMFYALCANNTHSNSWENYFIKKGMQTTGIKSLEDDV